MKSFTLFAALGFFAACSSSDKQPSIAGTWELVSATTIEKNDTTVIQYGKTQKFIKIINDTHFSFLQHDLNKGKDSTAIFVAGGGTYKLQGESYKEHLEFCSARDWEGIHPEFTVKVSGDTLIQQGREKVDNLGVDRIIIERYLRVK